MEIETVNAPRIKRRAPFEIRIKTYIIVAIYLFIASGSILKAHDFIFPIYIAIIAIIPFFIVNYALEWGYQLAFDEVGMYQRPKGWRWFFRRLPWYSIRYGDVRRIETIFAADGVIKRHFFPFEFILIYGRTGRDGDNIVIYPPAFQDREMKDFLLVLHGKCPELFPDEVVEFMHSAKSL